MRGEFPVETGLVQRDGVRIAYEIFGREGPILVLLPCWIIAHARSWKAQVADFAQTFRVVVVEGRGNGQSDRPAGPENYTYRTYADDALAVMDRLGVERCTLLGFSKGGPVAALIAAERPEQVDAVVLIAPVGPTSPEARAAAETAFLTPQAAYEGWARYNAHAMRADSAGFIRFFFDRMFCEPHSTKQIEDGVAWASETTGEVLVDSTLGGLRDDTDIGAAYAAIRAPSFVVHGDLDEIVPIRTGRKIAELCRAELMEMPGVGHGPHMRFPVLVNTAIRAFLTRAGIIQPPPARRRRLKGPPRALLLSSPIGLGHARRDLALATALRAERPGLTVDWLAQDPVTRLLQAAGERVHPASSRLALETQHIEDEAGEHDLNVFEALRRMDEVLVRNFRVFQEVVEAGGYDVVIADEGWEVDHFWHEHPELKRTQLAWLTDFVGFAPMPEGGRREAFLTSDYNGEMVGHVERRPDVRDRAIYVGNAEDVVDDLLGADLPGRREWTDRRFTYGGYLLGDGVPLPEEKAELRERLGFRPGEKVCVVTVGGSGVGRHLIGRILQAIPIARGRTPELRVIVVAGPRLQREVFEVPPGVEFRAFEPQLPSLLAAADLAIVQGGLSTTMELAACRTPFIYFPLKHHFEQNVHVAHRLAVYGAGRKVTYQESDPDSIAAAMVDEMASTPAWRPVERDGSKRIARLIAELL